MEHSGLPSERVFLVFLLLCSTRYTLGGEKKKKNIYAVLLYNSMRCFWHIKAFAQENGVKWHETAATVRI